METKEVEFLINMEFSRLIFLQMNYTTPTEHMQRPLWDVEDNSNSLLKNKYYYERNIMPQIHFQSPAFYANHKYYNWLRTTTTFSFIACGTVSYSSISFKVIRK